ncbi:MAG: polysaccharide lyase family 7 protein [Nevskia sp.]|nr:polysaccharide lyase family 7 protein [Nevskia sp.]
MAVRFAPARTALSFLNKYCGFVALALMLLCPLGADAGPGQEALHTQAVDTTPNQFSFTAVNNAAPDIDYASEAIVITGITGPSPVSITVGTYKINNESYRTAAGTVNLNDRVVVRVRASTRASTTVTATLTVGGVASAFRVTTAAATDTVPDSFSFAPVSNATLSRTYVSAPTTIAGINAPSPISVSGGLYRINDGPITALAGTVRLYDRVSAQVTASSQNSTAVTATVTVGGVRAPFTVTTAGSTSGRPSPAEVLNFTNWRLTLPINSAGGTSGLAGDISPMQLIGPPGYSSKFLYTDASGAVVFNAPSNGATTTPGEGSDNTRTELRELYKLSGPTEWTNGVGGTLTASCRVDRTPIDRKSVIIGQIHARGPILLLLTYDEAQRAVRAKFYNSPNGSAATTVQVASNIGIGDRIDYRIQWIGSNISVTVNGRTVNRQTASSWNRVGVYFKAGAYNGGSVNKGNSAGDASQVAFFTLGLQH